MKQNNETEISSVIDALTVVHRAALIEENNGLPPEGLQIQCFERVMYTYQHDLGIRLRHWSDVTLIQDSCKILCRPKNAIPLVPDMLERCTQDTALILVGAVLAGQCTPDACTPKHWFFTWRDVMLRALVKGFVKIDGPNGSRLTLHQAEALGVLTDATEIQALSEPTLDWLGEDLLLRAPDGSKKLFETVMALPFSFRQVRNWALREAG